MNKKIVSTSLSMSTQFNLFNSVVGDCSNRMLCLKMGLCVIVEVTMSANGRAVIPP